MLSCEACGRQVSDDALRCPACDHPVPAAAASFFGNGAHPQEMPLVGFADAPDDGPSESSPDTEAGDWDPDETTRLRPAYEYARHNRRNSLAVVSLSVALVAAVVSLAWLIGQSFGARPDTPATTSAPTPTTPLSSTPPRGAVICTSEVARSTNTSCAVATRVLAAVRTLGTDLPDKFRVTIVDPASQKNVTHVCAIKSWIECTGPGDTRVHVRRLA